MLANVESVSSTFRTVDSHTAAHLLHRCLKGPLMQGRSCILVTNAVSLCLPAAKFLVALDAGLVAYSGEPIGAPAHLVAQAIQVDVETNAKEAAAPAVDENAEGEAESNEETHRAGAVKWSVWQLYMSAFGGPIAWSIVLVLFTLAQGSEILQNLQLRAWAGSYTSSTLHTFVLAPLSVSDGDSTARYFRLYVLLSLSTLVLFIGRSLWVLFRGWRAARTLYDQLIRSVVGARTRFFDTVPGASVVLLCCVQVHRSSDCTVGRILNRLARDVSVIDAELSYMLNVRVDSRVCFPLARTVAHSFLYWRSSGAPASSLPVRLTVCTTGQHAQMIAQSPS